MGKEIRRDQMVSKLGIELGLEDKIAYFFAILRWFQEFKGVG